MQTVTVNGVGRSDVGKKATKAVRNEGMIPCVLYGMQEANHFAVKPNDVKHLIYTPEFKLADINIDGASTKCFIKDIQFHPVTDEIVHIDFLKLIDGHKVKLEVPVRFTGTSEGVKNGGSLQQSIRRVKVKTTPEKIIDKVEVDISHLNLGDSVRVKDIPEMEGVEIMMPGGTPLASVVVPRALKSAESAAATDAAAEGEGGEEAAAAAE